MISEKIRGGKESSGSAARLTTRQAGSSLAEAGRNVPLEDTVRVGSDATADVERPAAGGLSRDVVERLYAEHATALSALLWGVLHNRDTVAEVVQSTFARALERGGEVTPDKYKAWLFQVGFNSAIQIKRRETSGQKAILRKADADNRPADRTGADPLDNEPAGLDSLLRKETLDRVRQEMANLPPEQQVVVRRKLLEDKTYREIAVELGVAEGTVVTRLRLALEKLRRVIE